jgi:hypothetical protein
MLRTMLQSLAASELGLAGVMSPADQLKDEEERRRKALLKPSDTTGQPMLGPGSLAATMLGLASSG